MSLSLAQNATAIGFSNTTYFAASGGTSPYTYSVLGGGVGGTINPYTGKYTAPIGPIAENKRDTIQVIDSVSAIANSTILVDGALGLFCDIIQNQMSLDSTHIYFWDQKIMQPTDSNLYVAISVPMCKPFGNNISYVTGENGPLTNLFSYRTYPYPADPGTTPFNSYSSYNTNWNWLSYEQEVQAGLVAVQSVNMYATVDVDIISRGPAARDKKEFVLMALQSVYSEQQQEANGFYISPLTHGFINLSNIDGAAIPYRYKMSLALQYSVTNNNAVPYFNNFTTTSLVVNS